VRRLSSHGGTGLKQTIQENKDVTNRFGPRGVFALLIPQQNANMQPEYDTLRAEGISNQICRFDISDHDRVDQAVISVIGQTLGCWPDRVVVGNSIEMRLRNPERFTEYREKLQEQIGDVPLSTATEACVAALKTVGAKRIAALSPMSDAYSENVRDFYEAHGFEMPYHAGLQVKESKDIIRVSPEQALEGFRRLDHDDVDTFLHVGAALGIVDMIDDLEKELGRPIVSVNAATYWYAMRQHGITDVVEARGQLMKLTAIAG
jgi:maleate isomerase